MNPFESLVELARPYYEKNGDPSHDFAHIKRVMGTCKKLGKELGADLDVLLPAALLHDIVNVPKDSPLRAKGSELAADKAKEMMSSLGFDEGIINRVYQAIVEHSFSRGDKPTSLESKILQDSDRMDAIGAIGILRANTCGTKFKANYYHEEDPFAQNRELDDKSYTLDHYYTKLYKLPEMMNTQAAKDEAMRRVEFMKGFVMELENEFGF